MVWCGRCMCVCVQPVLPLPLAIFYSGGVFAVHGYGYIFIRRNTISLYMLCESTYAGVRVCFDASADRTSMHVHIVTCVCGVLQVPCSRIAHVFRKKSPYKFKDRDPHKTIAHNLNRVAAVWMDDFASIYFTQSGNDIKVPDYHVALEERTQLRQNIVGSPSDAGVHIPRGEPRGGQNPCGDAQLCWPRRFPERRSRSHELVLH
eukprot:m.755659 g.755659  ORF g.755659 m.755659 type:complete len:204 (-) comp23183_c0_seq9:668-1279(-)